MAAISSMIGLGLGAASMGFGLYNQMEGRDAAEEGYQLQQQGARIQQQAAQAQAQISKDQAASSVDFASRETALNNVAAGQSLTFAANARQINNQIVGYEQEIERQRRLAMELDARRRQKEIIRNQQRNRAIALTNATAQGARTGSGLQGGYAQISGQTGVNMLGVQQNLQIGRSIFDANQAITNQRINYADLQFNYAVQQADMQTRKSDLMLRYAQANANFQTAQADAGTLMSQGQGFIYQGGGQVSRGQGQQAFGTSLFNAGPSLFSMSVNASNVLGNNFFGSGGGSTPYMNFGGAGSYGVPTYGI